VARLLYSAITSLDGYVEDQEGRFDWAAPDDSVHAFVNDLDRPIGTYLYGRRMYETMVFWETAHSLADQSQVVYDYASIWQAANKVVYSRTLDVPSTKRTTIERDFNPDAVRDLKETSPSDISIGGPELAAQALKAGLVDKIQLFVNPVIVGGGKPALPAGSRATLTLEELRSFENGVVHLRYKVPGDK
jgi:dihydrofolate reductase